MLFTLCPWMLMNTMMPIDAHECCLLFVHAHECKDSHEYCLLFVQKCPRILFAQRCSLMLCSPEMPMNDFAAQECPWKLCCPQMPMITYSWFFSFFRMDIRSCFLVISIARLLSRLHTSTRYPFSHGQGCKCWGPHAEELRQELDQCLLFLLPDWQWMALPWVKYYQNLRDK